MSSVHKIAVIGTGYVGLTTGVCFAHLGHEVVCCDIDASKIEQLEAGKTPILESGIDQLLDRREQVDGSRWLRRHRCRSART